VIDCAVESVIAEVPVDRGIAAMLYNDVVNKVYVQSYLDSGPVTVLDAQTNQVLARLVTGNGGRSMCLNPLNNKVYCTALYGLTIIDGAGDSIIRQVRPGGYVYEVTYEPEFNRVYFTHSGGPEFEVVLLDGESNNIVGHVELGGWPNSLLALPELHRVYAANDELCCIQAIRTGAGGVVEQRPLPHAMRSTLGATVVGGVLWLPQPGTRSGLPGNPVMSRAVLLDATGRKALDLLPGPNDVRRLAPGIYFMRHASSIAKVVVTR